MFRHYLISALRNMAANKLQSAIATFGLSIGIAAAILASLVIANQTNFDRFFPEADRLYIVTVEATLGGAPTQYVPYTPHDLAARLKQDFGEIEAVARIKSGMHSLRNGNIEAQELVYDADPTIFRLLRLPVVSGNLETALAGPDSIVIPREIARKYFGREDVLGRTLELDRQHPLRITAVIADLPPNASNLRTGIFTAGRSAYSDLSQADRRTPNGRANYASDVQTLVQLRPGASAAALESRMQPMVDSLLPRPPNISLKIRLMRLDALHLSPNYSPGVRENLSVLGVVAVLILFLASVNFVNLSTARAVRRGVEVGVRKVAGADRSLLITQFLAEAGIQALFALFIAIGVVEWSLPAANAFLNTGGIFDYWKNPALIAILLLGGIAIGLIAGAYPALVLSAFRPATVLKGFLATSPRAGIIRSWLATSQFAILVILLIAAGVMLEQHRFAIHESLRLDTDQALYVHIPETDPTQTDRVSLCNGAFSTAVAALPGVRGVGCSDDGFIQRDDSWLVRHHDGSTTLLQIAGAGPGLLELYGQRPVAGRTLRPTDKISDTIQGMMTRTTPINVVINKTAAQKLGFASPRAAIGQALALQVGGPHLPLIVVGVVRDFSFSSPEQKIDPTAYVFFMQDFLIHIKLKAKNIPETLAGIDAAWNRTGPTGPIQLRFLDAYIENLHLALLREGQALLVFAGVAVLLGCLGLFGLSLSAAERRTKEIGVRKAMGGRDRDILALLLWQFAKPVLWANLIAWPIAFWAMNRWLNGFAYHVSLPLWIFPAVGLATLAIALLTVIGQALLVARQKPVLALRYE